MDGPSLPADEESKYEVEATLEDGSQVDVQLDADFSVAGTEDEGDEDKPDIDTSNDEGWSTGPRR